MRMSTTKSVSTLALTSCTISKPAKRRLSKSNSRESWTLITSTLCQRCSFSIDPSKTWCIKSRCTISRSGSSIRMTIRSTVSGRSSCQEGQFSSMTRTSSTRQTRRGRFFTRVAQVKSLSFARANLTD